MLVIPNLLFVAICLIRGLLQNSGMLKRDEEDKNVLKVRKFEDHKGSAWILWAQDESEFRKMSASKKEKICK